ncbi:hypothetical protein E8L90_24960 [Brevibacillus antibioticus]|uniref:Uncharacterized protein n=1 Tax=Brevibacillus antibioticus TaxID=2570228 RepID=A0A4U2YD63_9BACL|nr:hypothetical protein E8L90_24960 [Brevibacillus antibioticus]
MQYYSFLVFVIFLHITKVYNFIESRLSPLDFAIVVGMGGFWLLLKCCEYLSGVLEKVCIKFKMKVWQLYVFALILYFLF